MKFCFSSFLRTILELHCFNDDFRSFLLDPFTTHSICFQELNVVAVCIFSVRFLLECPKILEVSMFPSFFLRLEDSIFSSWLVFELLQFIPIHSFSVLGFFSRYVFVFLMVIGFARSAFIQQKKQLGVSLPNKGNRTTLRG